MRYLISVDLNTEQWIDKETQETLKMAVSTIVTDNLDCNVIGVRIGQYSRLDDQSGTSA